MATAHYSRVLLKFRRDVFDRPPGSWIAPRSDSGEAFSFWVNPGGHGVTHAIAGGRFALALELAGAPEAVGAALSVLRAMLGSRIDDAFEDGTATVWAQDPFARGAWVEAKPGNAQARAALLRPLAGRVFFAGEANHQTMPVTAAGAALIGHAVAAHVSGLVKAL